MRSKINVWKAGGLLGASALLALAGTTAAQADPLEETNAFCWHEQVTELEACADSAQELADAVLLKHGILILGPESEPEAAAAYAPSVTATAEFAATVEQARGGVSPAATYLIGALYVNTNRTGTSEVVTTNVTSNPCSSPGSYVYGYRSLGGSWNDVISSFEGFGHCGFRLFADANFGGSIYGPYFLKNTLGPFDNLASSYEAQKID